MTSLDPAATSKLQFAVGVATIAYNSGQSVAYGLNTVLTLRQPDGLSGTLYNIPQIIGPTSFNVLTSTETGSDVQSAGSDFGTNHVTWSTLNQPQWTGAPRGQKASSTGAFGYGFCPCNSDSGPVNGTSPRLSSLTACPSTATTKRCSTAALRRFRRRSGGRRARVGKATRWALRILRYSR